MEIGKITLTHTEIRKRQNKKNLNIEEYKDKEIIEYVLLDMDKVINVVPCNQPLKNLIEIFNNLWITPEPLDDYLFSFYNVTYFDSKFDYSWYRDLDGMQVHIASTIEAEYSTCTQFGTFDNLDGFLIKNPEFNY